MFGKRTMSSFVVEILPIIDFHLIDELIRRLFVAKYTHRRNMYVKRIVMTTPFGQG